MTNRYLQGDLLSLRSFELSDAETLHRWEHDETAWASSTTLAPLSAEFVREYIIRSVDSIITQRELSLLLQSRDNHTPVGYLQFLAYDPISRRVGLGLFVAPEHRRKGYAKEAVQLAIRYAFGRLGVSMLYADILESNVACCRLFDELGFTHTATLPKWHYAEGEYHNLRYYQLWDK